MACGAMRQGASEMTTRAARRPPFQSPLALVPRGPRAWRRPGVLTLVAALGLAAAAAPLWGEADAPFLAGEHPAGGLRVSDGRVTGRVLERPVGEVLEGLCGQATCRYEGGPEVLAVPVSAEFRDRPWEEALGEVLKPFSHMLFHDEGGHLSSVRLLGRRGSSQEGWALGDLQAPEGERPDGRPPGDAAAGLASPPQTVTGGRPPALEAPDRGPRYAPASLDAPVAVASESRRSAGAGVGASAAPASWVQAPRPDPGDTQGPVARTGGEGTEVLAQPRSEPTPVTDATGAVAAPPAQPPPMLDPDRSVTRPTESGSPGGEESSPPPPAQGTVALRSFATCGQLESYIEDAAVKQMQTMVDSSGGDGRTWPVLDRVAIGAQAVPATASADAEASALASAPTASTATNQQVSGVDEPDFVKNDGTRIFMLKGNVLHAIKSWPPQDLAHQGELTIEGYPTQMTLHADKDLVVVFSTVDGSAVVPQGGGTPESVPRLGLSMPCYVGSMTSGALSRCGWAPPATKISVVDVSDLTTLRVVRELYLPGSYVHARSIGTSVRVVLRDEVRWPAGVGFYAHVDYPAPPPPVFAGDRAMDEAGWALASGGVTSGRVAAPEGIGNGQGKRVEALSRADYEQRLNAAREALKERNESLIRAQGLADWLPAGRIRLADGTGGDLAYDCTDFGYEEVDVRFGLVSVLTLDLERPDSVSRTTVVGEVDQIYASTESLYLSSQHWMWAPELGDEEHTHVHKLDIRAPDRARHVASGRVEGHILNQFSMDEHAGFLRLATTVNEVAADPEAPWRIVPSSRVSVLGVEDGVLKLVGETAGLARGERVQSVRFIGNRGFVVTFRQVDPLFTLDLSDPTAPRVVGELKVPGFSSYIHPLGEDHLLTIGTYLPESGVGERRVQIALFDVSDMATPRQKFLHLVDSPSATSAAQWDHKAFNFFPEKGLLAVPYTDYAAWTWEGPAGTEAYWGGLISELRIYHVDQDKGITPQGALPLQDMCAQPGGFDWPWHCSPEVRRSVMATNDVDDFVYAISDAGVRVAELDALDAPLATALLPLSLEAPLTYEVMTLAR